ncbi:hypothetical protein Q3408_09870 [Staphylococcus saprophyticus]|nr:hypothetical protein Q3408_09870 [Staphylococcus saprophyticus]
MLKSTANQIIVTGGILYQDNYLLNGMITNETLKLFNPSKLFLATPAIDLEKGLHILMTHLLLLKYKW